MKLLILAAIVVIGWKLLLGRWPWEGRGVTPQAVEKARALLGVRAGADREAILVAHRQLIGIVHPDRGGSSAAVHEADAARDLLLAELNDGGPGGGRKRVFGHASADRGFGVDAGADAGAGWGAGAGAGAGSGGDTGRGGGYGNV